MKHIKVFENFNENQKWLDLLIELTSKTTPAGKEANVEHILFRYGFRKDEYGNYCKLTPQSRILFTAHADNYCSEEQKVNHVITEDKLATDGKTILGGDNKVGIVYLISMIEAGKDYNYYIFHSEEIGRVGSKELLAKKPEFLKNIDLAITIDRRETKEIIITQSGAPCCSREAASDIKVEFAKQQLPLEISEHGGRSDTYTFRNVVRECVNISDGVYGEHTVNEYVDLNYFYKMIDSLKKVKFENVSINRIPETEFHKIKFRKMKDILTVKDMRLHIDSLETDKTDDDYINCYFKLNNQDTYKAIFYSNLDVRFARLVKVNFLKKGEKVQKMKDVKFRVPEAKPLDAKDKLLILDTIQEFIMKKLLH